MGWGLSNKSAVHIIPHLFNIFPRSNCHMRESAWKPSLQGSGTDRSLHTALPYTAKEALWRDQKQVNPPYLPLTTSWVWYSFTWGHWQVRLCQSNARSCTFSNALNSNSVKGQLHSCVLYSPLHHYTLHLLLSIVVWIKIKPLQLAMGQNSTPGLCHCNRFSADNLRL